MTLDRQKHSEEREDAEQSDEKMRRLVCLVLQPTRQRDELDAVNSGTSLEALIDPDSTDVNDLVLAGRCCKSLLCGVRTRDGASTTEDRTLWAVEQRPCRRTRRNFFV